MALYILSPGGKHSAVWVSSMGASMSECSSCGASRSMPTMNLLNSKNLACSGSAQLSTARSSACNILQQCMMWSGPKLSHRLAELLGIRLQR